MTPSIRSVQLSPDRDGVLRSMATKIEHLRASTNKRVRDFTESLTKRKRRHDDDLDEASLRHDRVRNLAEAVQIRYEEARLEAIRRAEEAELKRKAALDEQQRLETEADRIRIEQANAAKQQEIDRLRLQDQENKWREEDEQRRKEQDRIAQRKAEEQATKDAELKAKEEAQKKEDAAKEALNRSNHVPIPYSNNPPQTTNIATTPTTVPPSTDQAMAPQFYVNDRARTEHEAFLTLHARLKALRKQMKTQAQQNPRLKSTMGDMRRELVKRVGQISEDKASIRTVEIAITSVLITAANTTSDSNNPSLSPTLPVSDFYILHPWHTPAPDPATLTALHSQTLRAPSLLLYLLSIFTKALLAQLRAEASLKPMIATNLGILTAKLLAQPKLHASGLALLPSVLLAKYHAACPLLFGSYGSESTAAGRRVCGWALDRDTGEAVTETQHLSDQLGLASGFAALTLRSFPANSAMRNQMPGWRFWQAVARVAGVPVGRVGMTAVTVLRGLVMGGNAKRVLELFGSGGVALLRYCVVELPEEIGRSGRVGVGKVGGPTEASVNSLVLVRDDMRRIFGRDVLEMRGRR